MPCRPFNGLRRPPAPAATAGETRSAARAILTYDQSINPASPHANDQLRQFTRKQWPALPFHREDVLKARVGEPLWLILQ